MSSDRLSEVSDASMYRSSSSTLVRRSKFFKRRSSTFSATSSTGLYCVSDTDRRLCSCEPFSISSSFITENPNESTNSENVSRPESRLSAQLIEDVQIIEIAYSNPLEKRLIEQIYKNPTKLDAYIKNSIRNLKAFLTEPDENDCMPLYYAIKSRSLNSIKLLLHYGADKSRTTKLGDPVAHVAALVGANLSLFEYLLTCLDSVYETDQEGWTVFHCACNQGHIHIVEYLVTKTFFNINTKELRNQNTGLHLAATNNHVNIVEYLLKFSASKQARAQTAQTYPSQVMDINSRNNYGQTPLHYACDTGSYETVELMLKSNGSNSLNVNLKDFKGNTCLDLAWSWLIQCKILNKTTDKCIEIFYNSHMYVQKNGLLDSCETDAKLKILNILCKYGAKFSSIEKILFNFEQFNNFDRQSETSNDYFSSISMPIGNYLKTIVHLLKLEFSLNKCFFDQKLYENLTKLKNFIQLKVPNQFERNVYLERLDIILRFFENKM